MYIHIYIYIDNIEIVSQHLCVYVTKLTYLIFSMNLYFKLKFKVTQALHFIRTTHTYNIFTIRQFVQEMFINDVA